MYRFITMSVTALNHSACSRIEGFVREALGCACPPGVFGDIRLETGPDSFPDFPGARLLAIGGRLLLLLVDTDAADMDAGRISVLLERGRVLRDAGGFNRFRLVIASPALAATEPGNAPGGDDRLHLHRIATSQLPDLLRAPEVQ